MDSAFELQFIIKTKQKIYPKETENKLAKNQDH